MFIATLFLPFWFQLILYVIFVFFIKYKYFMILPAIFSDALYSPEMSFGISNIKTLLIVLVLIVFYTLIIKKTRLGQKYVLEKK